MRGARKHPQLQLHKSEPPDCNPSPHLFPVEYFQGSERVAKSTSVECKELPPRAALTVDFLTSRRSGLLPALGNGLLWFLRRLNWPCGEGRPGHRERFHRSNCAQEGSGRTDRGPLEPHGAHIPVALRGGGPWGGSVDSLIAQRCTTFDPVGDGTTVVAQPAGEFRE